MLWTETKSTIGINLNKRNSYNGKQIKTQSKVLGLYLYIAECFVYYLEFKCFI